jgi:hypothetical protein
MAIDAKQDIQSARIPFAGNFLARMADNGILSGPYFSETTDQYFQNGLFWKIDNSLTGKSTFYFASRPGYSRVTAAPSGVDEANAMHYWPENNATYITDQTQLWKDGTKIATFPAASFPVPPQTSAPTQFSEIRPGATTPYLCYNNGKVLLVIETNNRVTVLRDLDVTSVSAANPAVVTTASAHGLTSGVAVILRDVSGSTPDVNGTQYTITVTGATTFTIPVNVTVAGTGGNLGNFPANNGNLIYMNGRLFVGNSDGQIYNCDLDDPLMWDTTRVITAQMYAGLWRALARQNNFLLNFSDFTVQAFVDDANTEGSPLDNYESGITQVGCDLPQSIVTNGSEILWIGTTSSGQRSVFRMRGLTSPEEVVTTPIRNAIEQYAAAGAIRRCFFWRIGGKNLYVVPVSRITYTSGATSVTTDIDALIYDMDLNIWNQWKYAGADGAFFTATTYNTYNSYQLVLQSDGTVWAFQAYETTDANTSATIGSGSAFDFLVQTERIDFGTIDRKFVQRLEMIGDKVADTANVSVSYCDDDNETFSTARTLDMSQSRPFLPQGGNFRRRRYKFVYAGNQAQRWEGFELFFRSGK